MNGQTGFFYLNLENRWPALRLVGLLIDAAGALTLEQVPYADPPVSLSLPAPDGAAGVTIDGEGSLYLSDPASHHVLKKDLQLPERVLTLGEEGELPGQFRQPRGLAIGWPEALYVADSGNHRIQIFDQHTLQLRGVLGQPEAYASPEPGEADGRFNDPWDVATDRACSLYVVDHGNRRVQKFDRLGRVAPEFWRRVAAGTPLVEPTHITVGPAQNLNGAGEGAERIYLVDRARRQVLVYNPAGDFLMSWGAEVFGEPSGIAALGAAVYVGDNQRRRVLKFRAADGVFTGEALGYEGPVAGLGVDESGNLWVHPGTAEQAVRLEVDAAYAPGGSFLAGPFKTEDVATLWHRLRVEGGPLPENTHLQLFAYTSNAPIELPFTAEEENPFTAPAWQPIARDALDALIPSVPVDPDPAGLPAGIPLTGGIPSTPARFLWLGGWLQSDGLRSPAIRQIRVDYGRETYLRYLPAIYARQAASRDFLERFLALFESVLGGVEETIDHGLPQLFDPQAAPDRFLPWLAGWLAFDLVEDWSSQEQRQRIAEAFQLHARRGTPQGLSGALKLYAGVEAIIEEPPLQTNLWSLGEVSVLGFSTMLAPAYPDGAVLGVSATLDQSNLSPAEDYGAALFEDMAFHFCVQIHRSELDRSNALEEVQAVLEREKPAHTSHHLCVIEPRMRVGFQARLGIDSIVASRPPELELGGSARWGFAHVAPQAESRRQAGGSLGQDAQVGQKTTLT